MSIYFSKFPVTQQVFFQTKHSYALVNLKPLVPGHVLVVPLRTSVVHLADLTAEENADYFNTLQIVHKFIKEHFKADSLNIAIQDGPEAGQSIPHLHTHIIPRYKIGNIGDEIYAKIDTWDARRDAYLFNNGREGRRELAKPDDQRIERTPEVMHAEATELAEKLKEFMSK